MFRDFPRIVCNMCNIWSIGVCVCVFVEQAALDFVPLIYEIYFRAISSVCLYTIHGALGCGFLPLCKSICERIRDQASHYMLSWRATLSSNNVDGFL